MNDIKHNGCKGCRLRDVMIMTCDMDNEYNVNKEQIVKCPCMICLVKGMCSRYCNDYFVYVGGYFEYIKANPMAFIERHIPPDDNHIYNYELKSYRGIPITVKYDIHGERVKIGPSITMRGSGIKPEYD
jgi:hypothetical protein